MRIALLLLVAACGDNVLLDGEPLVPAANLTVIAHQDDDLIFMQPDLRDVVARGDGLTNVYVTAGNGTKGYEYAESRELGLMAAYADVAGKSVWDWKCGWITVADHPAEHCRLDSANVSLVFLGYPDGGKQGEQPSSLLHLWEGKIATATTVSRKPSKYTQGELIAAIAEIATTTQPATLRTLDVASTHGRDHADHLVVGALALLGLAEAQVAPAILSYRAYNIEDEPVDKIDPLFAPEAVTLAHYDACVDHCAACGDACPSISEAHGVWLHRRYAIGFRHTATTQIAIDGTCIGFVPDGTVSLGDCATAPVWTFTASGAVTTGDHCLQSLPTGELVAAPCTATDAVPPERRFFLDDESHIWSGVPPVAVDGMDLKHMNCLVSSGGHARAVLCGDGIAPAWTLTRAAVAGGAAPAGALEIRLADLDGDGKADLVFRHMLGFGMLKGNGDGTFGAQTTMGANVDGSAIAVGDVDGDGVPDLCSLGATGVECELAAEQFMTPHTRSTDLTDGSQTTRESFAVFGDAVCGESGGLVCESGSMLQSTLISSWPAQLPLAVGDLDGDHRVDWCTLTPTGASCGLGGDAAITTDGAPWAFALAGTVDTAPLGVPSAGLADIDGDGLADLCAIDGDHVSCTRSNAHGFGPRMTLAPLTGDTLLLGDLDGDGHADACTLAGSAVTCALSP